MEENSIFRIAFFDHNINFGGAPKGTVELVSMLSKDVSSEIYDAFGGSEHYRNAIASHGIKCYVCCPKQVPSIIGGSGLVRTLKLLQYMPIFIAVTIGLNKIVKERNPSVIWVNNAKSLLPVFLVSLVKTLEIILYIRGEVSDRVVSRKYLFLMKYCTSHIICNSQSAVRNLIDLGISKEKVTFVPNSVSVNITGKQVYEKNTSRPIIILPAARPTEDKGYVECIEAFAKFRHRFNVGSLKLLGEVSFSQSDDFLDFLKRKIKDLDVEAHVTWVGYISNVADYIEQSDIVVLPSYSEGFPRVILESMLLKTPFVCTPVADMNEIVSEHSVGLICKMKDSESLFDCMQAIYENPIEKQQSVENAFEYVHKYHMPELQVSGVLKVFRSV